MITNSEEAPIKKIQHKKPCHDCPLRKNALPGWLGGSSPEEYAQLLHSDEQIDCHTFKGPQCAGAAIFRRNVCKMPRNPEVLMLTKSDKVFQSTQEFVKYHKNEQ